MSNLVKLQETGLELNVLGAKAYFNYFWLRDNCSTSWDESTQERTYDILQEPNDLKPKSAVVENDVLNVVWPCGHVSSYTLDWLDRWHTGKNHGDIAIRHRKPWYSDHYANLARFDYETLAKEPAEVANWTEAMLDEGVALITNMPDGMEALPPLVELIGCVRPSFSGYDFDVQSKPNPENLAYTSVALELHTDLPPEELAPGIQFLHCLVNESTGGDSLFVDAVAVANALKEQNPEYFEILTQYKVPYRYTTSWQDVRSKQYVIEIDPNNGEVSGINYSQHLSDIFDLPQKTLDTYYAAFRAFGNLMLDKKFLMRFRLEGTQCIVFDNHRIVHARAEFDPNSGPRRLHGCYLDRGDLRSAYRVLRAQNPS